MSTAGRDEEAGPGNRPGSGGYDAIARERIRSVSEKVDDLWKDADEMADILSDVRKVQVGQGMKLETLVEFHTELKKYARWAITGVFGVIFLQVLQLVLKKGTP